jgi:hypothetical protein
MHYPLSVFRTISKIQLQKLEAIAIFDSDTLLNQAALPTDREALARRSGLTHEEITELASIADLVRIKGIGPHIAEVLVEFGLIGNVQIFLEATRALEVTTPRQNRLAESPTVQSAVANLVKQLKSRGKKWGGQNSLPSAHRLIESAEEALELKPRLVLTAPENNIAFREKLFTTWRTESRFSWRTNRWWLFSLFLILTITVLVGLFIRYQNFYIPVQTPLDARFDQFLRDTNIYLLVDFFIMFGVLLLTLGTVYLCWRIYSYLTSTYLKLWLFNAKVYQNTYDAIQVDLEKEKTASWAVVFVFCLMAIFFMFEVARFADDGQEIVNILGSQMSVFMPLLGAIVCIPTLLKLIEFRRKAISETAIRRFIIYRIIMMVALPAVTLLATRIMVPATFQLHTGIMEKLVMPHILENADQTRTYIQSYPADNAVDGFAKEYYLSFMDDWNETNARKLLLFVSPQDYQSIDQFVQIGSQAILALIGVAILFLFILPYLIYGGVGKGIFYILLLWIAQRLDSFLQNSSPTWFRVPPNPTTTAIIIGMCLLSSALFFDWLYDFITDQPKFCPACGQELAAEDLHCRYCGMVMSETPKGNESVFKFLPAHLLRRRQ